MKSRPGQLDLFANDPAPVNQYGARIASAPLPHNGTPSSIEAAESITGAKVKADMIAIYRALRAAPDGLTDEQGQAATGLPGNTYRPRRLRLDELGYVVATGARRRTASGRFADVWGVARDWPEADAPQPQETGPR